jgi:lipid II:glycine glycyltransferase (peptidoglycan interpeptide bridge formation enzyme)
MLQYTSSPLSVLLMETLNLEQLLEWDALVDAHPGGDVTQLSGWGRLRRLAGYTSLYVLAFYGGQIVGGAQILVRQVPALGRVGYAPYGPLVFRHAERPDEVHTALADAFRDLVRNRLRVLFVQPPLGGERSSRALMDRGFRLSDAGISPASSLRVDLDADIEELRRNLTKRLRKRTNQWPRQGVTVRVGGVDDLPQFAELVRQTGEHQGFPVFDLNYFTTMHRELSADGHFVLFIGEYEGHPVSAQLCTGCGDTLTARMTGFDRSSPGAHLRVPAAVIWTAIQWGKANGYRWFDLGSVEERSMAVLEAGGSVDDMPSSDQIKMNFGGQPFRYPPAVEFIASPVVRLGYDLARRSPVGRVAVARVERIARFGRGLPRSGAPAD